MFEKEAEEWAIDNVCKDCSRYEKCMGKEQCTCKDCSKEKWQNGAEFGFQKGIKAKVNTTTISDCPIKTQWHNLQENPEDLPEEVTNMTDDELAEEYIDEHSPSFKEYPKAGRGALKQAFLAGLEAGRPVWHRVADGDLPKEPEFLKNDPDNHRYEWFIVASVGKPTRALYSFAKKKWFIDYEEMMVGSYFEPIAWCEFPKFEE